MDDFIEDVSIIDDADRLERACSDLRETIGALSNDILSEKRLLLNDRNTRRSAKIDRDEALSSEQALLKEVERKTDQLRRSTSERLERFSLLEYALDHIHTFWMKEGPRLREDVKETKCMRELDRLLSTVHQECCDKMRYLEQFNEVIHIWKSCQDYCVKGWCPQANVLTASAKEALTPLHPTLRDRPFGRLACHVRIVDSREDVMDVTLLPEISIASKPVIDTPLLEPFIHDAMPDDRIERLRRQYERFKVEYQRRMVKLENVKNEREKIAKEIDNFVNETISIKRHIAQLEQDIAQVEEQLRIEKKRREQLLERREQVDAYSKRVDDIRKELIDGKGDQLMRRRLDESICKYLEDIGELKNEIKGLLQRTLSSYASVQKEHRKFCVSRLRSNCFKPELNRRVQRRYEEEVAQYRSALASVPEGGFMPMMPSVPVLHGTTRLHHTDRYPVDRWAVLAFHMRKKLVGSFEASLNATMLCLSAKRCGTSDRPSPMLIDGFPAFTIDGVKHLPEETLRHLCFGALSMEEEVACAQHFTCSAAISTPPPALMEQPKAIPSSQRAERLVKKWRAIQRQSQRIQSSRVSSLSLPPGKRISKEMKEDALCIGESKEEVAWNHMLNSLSCRMDMLREEESSLLPLDASDDSSDDEPSPEMESHSMREYHPKILPVLPKEVVWMIFRCFGGPIEALINDNRSFTMEKYDDWGLMKDDAPASLVHQSHASIDVPAID